MSQYADISLLYVYCVKHTYKRCFRKVLFLFGKSYLGRVWFRSTKTQVVFNPSILYFEFSKDILKDQKINWSLNIGSTNFYL